MSTVPESDMKRFEKPPRKQTPIFPPPIRSQEDEILLIRREHSQSSVYGAEVISLPCTHLRIPHLIPTHTVTAAEEKKEKVCVCCCRGWVSDAQVKSSLRCTRGNSTAGFSTIPFNGCL
ncbi:hypothetical protein CDAR_231801 [Caerostris darwini]|uniref:Uncharacterized protein n=1 Tax=Caerostris darwini TaxID=1538125 RepID=A0AAV4TX89_9ARAC|nr:hypothetical protein CDAR_231801 [Caerostris darwini]